MIWNVIFMIVTKCQNMLRWSRQNANQKVGTDKMPTTEISPDKMPTFGIMSGWHFVRLAFCPHTFGNVNAIYYPHQNFAHLLRRLVQNGIFHYCLTVAVYGIKPLWMWHLESRIYKKKIVSLQSCECL